MSGVYWGCVGGVLGVCWGCIGGLLGVCWGYIRVYCGCQGVVRRVHGVYEGCNEVFQVVHEVCIRGVLGVLSEAHAHVGLAQHVQLRVGPRASQKGSVDGDGLADNVKAVSVYSE